MSENKLFVSAFWDKLGIGISGVCAIHCLLLPVFIALLPLWGLATVLHDWLHPVFILLIAPTVYYASRRSHFDRRITGILIAGFFMILFGWVFGHYWIGHLFESVVTFIGSVVLITGHWLNYRHHQTCSVRNHNHHPLHEEEQVQYHEAS